MKEIMEIDNKQTDRKYLRAKKRVDQLKSFYTHLLVYVLVNLFISSVKLINDVRGGDTLEEAFTDFDNFSLWLWWGIGILFHTYRVFGAGLLFMNKDWEEKKIKEFMNEK